MYRIHEWCLRRSEQLEKALLLTNEPDHEGKPNQERKMGLYMNCNNNVAER